MKRFTASFTWMLLTVSACAASDCAPAFTVDPSPYPRVADYAHDVDSLTTDASGNCANCARLARWTDIIVEADRADATTRAREILRSMAPAATLLGYVNVGNLFVCSGGWWWKMPHVAGCDTSNFHAAWVRNEVVRKYDAVLYSLTRDQHPSIPGNSPFSLQETSGPPTPLWTGPITLDFAMPGFASEYADSIAAIINTTPSLFNGAFMDEICTGITWTENFGDSIDYAHAGFINLATWDAAYQAGVATFFTRLKTVLAGKFIVGNCGGFGPRNIHGWMRENFPEQNGGTWESNMLGQAGVAGDVGLIGDDLAYTSPRMTWITIWRSGVSQTSSEGRRKQRLVLGSACLTDHARGVVTGTVSDNGAGPIFWWADEFAVTPAGVATTDTTHRGWLGLPLSKATGVGKAWRREFQGGMVLVNANASISGVSLVIPLQSSGRFRRIKGTVDPNVNNGQYLDGNSSVTVAPGDAVFLVRVAQ